MFTYEDVKREYDQIFANRTSLETQKKHIGHKIQTIRKKISSHTDARAILNDSIKVVHKKFKERIERIITRAVKRVFERDITFELRYEEKRNSIESVIIVKENGLELDPKDDLGGSLIDIISFTFRIVLWYISPLRSRNTFILDEPFKWTGKLITLTGMVMKELAEELNFQIIIITHDDELIQIADKIFKVDYYDGRSHITSIRGRNYNENKMSNVYGRKKSK